VIIDFVYQADSAEQDRFRHYSAAQGLCWVLVVELRITKRAAFGSSSGAEESGFLGFDCLMRRVGLSYFDLYWWYL